MTLKCGCIIYNEPRSVGFCPLHRASEAMLEALHSFCRVMAFSSEKELARDIGVAYKKARAAISAAEAEAGKEPH